MSLVERISKDLIQALKQKDSERALVLRSIKATLKNLEIEKRIKIPDDALTLTALQKEAKKRKEAMTLYEQAQRHDLAKKESSELTIIETYLPKQLSEQELQEIIQKIITESSEKNFGHLMKATMSHVKGRVDGKLVQTVLKKMLEAK
ncbi:MAG: hypothetical protein A3B74_00325 [Candidatus Kerfeldbacteria bacterium RIFCSPHIGHO2_02_FULL_42_14]|uniref:Glutamyl-tRNA amidotransferase n=1 Tax=Candidatus Kerfeldbacteria bacterium RIFCSPHIGHO2_02_FULL_42_14 TaxID=1798540 RepID=A0A1G2AQU9_9BACT|nr:MAG: hypothetical protein A3B74_00325 [Candidatus Kerfeldbacteria bacterium RIFCSPHIGHO2_02_FULL_42_14]OGY81279.1 MAG: hypothetical protein A3E60_02405 [Candidatus Kerfeldbacteria bacterium RIFCSPHIGHO2_12_FULL_42_13]OGY83554.1 MAG: hypothetical protein A3I91_02840 [Candidatus Kerfeldbacteria bacterium RIFCSPLOWO2_02_FULL_42_19]OGY87415.1 MAG: hypothetical protein A3G01_04440 [Candidatus Kerfeldbacteria bacterium RIFCSPLOWO2_12_FULL_43_9]